MGGPHPGASHRQPHQRGVPAVRAGRPGPGGDRDLARHPRHPPAGLRAPGWPGDRRTHLRLGGPRQHLRPDLELSRHGPAPLHHAARGRAAKHRRRIPAGQRDDEPARTAGQPRTEARVGQMAELAHHRRPARRRARPADAQRQYRCAPPGGRERRARTGQRAREPAVHQLTAAPRAARRSRLSWLRALPLLARPVTRTMPWATLITGCLAGTVYLAVTARLAGVSPSPLGRGPVPFPFLPAVAALAFVPRAPFRPLTQTTPVPARVAPAGHLLLAAPVLAVTCW